MKKLLGLLLLSSWCFFGVQAVEKKYPEFTNSYVYITPANRGNDGSKWGYPLPFLKIGYILGTGESFVYNDREFKNPDLVPACAYLFITNNHNAAQFIIDNLKKEYEHVLRDDPYLYCNEDISQEELIEKIKPLAGHVNRNYKSPLGI